MPHIRIIASDDQEQVRVTLNERVVTIPFDGCFHPVEAEILVLLDDSSVTYEIENVGARGGAAALAGGARMGEPGRRQPDPFDHDGDGKSGGSKKGARSTVAKGIAAKTRALLPRKSPK